MGSMQLGSPIANMFKVFLITRTSYMAFQSLFRACVFAKSYGLEFRISLDLGAFVFEAGAVEMATAAQNAHFACRVTTL